MKPQRLFDRAALFEKVAWPVIAGDDARLVSVELCDCDACSVLDMEGNVDVIICGKAWPYSPFVTASVRSHVWSGEYPDVLFVKDREANKYRDDVGPWPDLWIEFYVDMSDRLITVHRAPYKNVLGEVMKGMASKGNWYDYEKGCMRHWWQVPTMLVDGLVSCE